jgi:hypothetical protein
MHPGLGRFLLANFILFISSLLLLRYATEDSAILATYWLRFVGIGYVALAAIAMTVRLYRRLPFKLTAVTEDGAERWEATVRGVANSRSEYRIAVRNTQIHGVPSGSAGPLVKVS